MHHLWAISRQKTRTKMPEKITVEEEKKLNKISEYLQKLTDTPSAVGGLIERQNQLCSNIKQILPQLGIHISEYKTHRDYFYEILQDEMFDDLLESDPLKIPDKTKGIIEKSQSIILTYEQIVRLLFDFILDFIEKSNDLSTSFPKQIPRSDEGEFNLNDEQFAEFKKKMRMIITEYKNSDTHVAKKLLAHRVYFLSDTVEKFAISNGIFMEEVGKKILDEIKSEKERILKQNGHPHQEIAEVV